jgi:CTP:molybdopterin cytidylyltransferase MocA
MQHIAILIPAAGASTRMRGDDKLLRTVDGQPLLRRQVRRAVFTGAHVCVAVPNHENPRAHALSGLPVQIVEVPDAANGMSCAIRRGVGMLPKPIHSVMILPADMPDLDSSDLLKIMTLAQSTPQDLLFQGCAEDGTPGHPVLFPKDCFHALQTLTGDRGARQVLSTNQQRLRYVPLPQDHAVTDLDTPEAWHAWEKKVEDPVI